MRHLSYYLSALLVLMLVGCNQPTNQYQGYVEGRFRYISSDFDGILENLLVKRGDHVKANQDLFILNQESETDELKNAQAQVSQIEAQIKQNEANLALTEVTYQRQKSLLVTGATSQQSFDTAESDFLQAQAQLKNSNAALLAAQAVVAKSQWTLEQKTMSAPIDSFVFDTYFLPGEQVPAGHPVLALLADVDVKIIFFIPEVVLGKVSIGEMVHVSCDSCPKNLSATVDYISPQAEYTPPVIYSVETREQLVYRIEAMPDPNQNYEFHPGQPVSVELK